MPLYMTQVSYTPEAMAKMISSTDSRSSKVAKHIEQVGGKMVCFYFTFGDYDAVGIFDIPDGVSALSVLSAAWSADFLTKIKTTEIFSAEEAHEAFKKAGSVELTPPKG